MTKKKATATLIKSIDSSPHHQCLYQLSPPLEGHKFVVVSAASVPFSGPETYIFPSDANGVITSWGELRGSYRGSLSHVKALRMAGYTIKG